MATGGQTEYWSEEYVEYQCALCETNKKVTNADNYCFDCHKFLCYNCLPTHNTLITTHKILSFTGDTIKQLVTEKCEKHPKEVIQYFCRQHDALLCQICQEQDHKKCQEPQNIRESSDELNADPELQAVPAQLKSALDNINKDIEALDKHVAKIQHSGDGFLKGLEDNAKKLLSRIEELREKSKKDIKSKQKELLSVTKQHRQACSLTKDEINQCLEKITKSKDWKANMFILKKKGQTIAQKVDSLHSKLESVIKGCQFNFLEDMKIFDSVNFFNSLIEEDSTKVEDVSSQCAVEGEVDRPVQETLRRPGEEQGKKPSVEQALYSKHVRTINTRIPEDKTDCNIYGFCRLNDGSLVVADSSNRRLKLVDPSRNTVTKYCHKDGASGDICCIGPQEVAVAAGSTKVQVYNTVSLTRTRTVEMGHETFWIACHGGLLYCVEWGDILYVHDVRSGRKLREISMDTDGRKLFSSIQHIAVNSSGDRLYVADGRRGLVCVGVDGRQIFCLSHQDLGLSGARGVTTDHHGHVFVCGYSSYNVVKVTEDGHVVGQILSKEDGVTWRPSCLSYDVSRSFLYVGGFSDQLLMVEWK